jgi:NAD+ kinase
MAGPTISTKRWQCRQARRSPGANELSSLSDDRPKRYHRIAFVASAGTEAQAALKQLTALYGNHNAADAGHRGRAGGDG